jgi:hypothetical protein
MPPAVRNGCAFPGGLAIKALGYAPRFVVTNKVPRYAPFLPTQKQGAARKQTIRVTERRSHSAQQAAEPKTIRWRRFWVLALH